MDVVVVVDGSFSIGKSIFDGALKQTLIGLTDNLFGLGRDLKMGLVLYSIAVDETIALSNSIANVKTSINGLKYPNSATWTHLGIKAATDMLVNNGRTDSTKVRKEGRKEGRKEMFYLTMHSTHFYLRLLWRRIKG